MIKTVVKDILCATDSPLLQYWLPRYRYNVTPAILAFVCHAVEATGRLPGPIVEIGCDTGATTIFLNKHMDDLGIDKPYICVDTFSGFTAADIAHEVTVRRKNDAALRQEFTGNSQRWFDKTMQLNRITRVRSIKADVNEFDFAGLERISFCFIDVDLYRPVKASLEKIYDRMDPLGIIAVDDCTMHPNHDGAFQAYSEFVDGRHLASEVVCGRLGVIRMPSVLGNRPSAS